MIQAMLFFKWEQSWPAQPRVIRTGTLCLCSNEFIRWDRRNEGIRTTWKSLWNPAYPKFERPSPL